MQEDTERRSAQEEVGRIEEESIPNLRNDLFWQLGQAGHFRGLIRQNMRSQSRAELTVSSESGRALKQRTEWPMMWTLPFFSKSGLRAIQSLYSLFAWRQTASIIFSR